MTTWSEAFAQTVRTEPVDLTRACLQLGAEAAERDGRQRVDPLNQSLGQLESLAADVTNQGDGVTRLRRTLAGFQGDPSDYDDLRSSLLPDVLDRRRGLPILLSVVWLDVARRVGIPAYGVGLPGHFVVAVGDPDGYHEVVDPFAGGASLRPSQVTSLVEQSTGARPGRSDLRPWEPVEILQRILANVRAWANRPERLSTRRWAIERALLLPRHPLDLRRQHGMVLVQLGGFAEGAEALEQYANLVEPVDAQAADKTRALARKARSRLN